MIRAFIAIDLPETALETLDRIQRRLVSRLATGAIRWSSVKSTHLTLKFLGDVEESHIADVSRAFRDSTQNASAFKLALGALGCFPSFEKPSVVWIGVGGELSALHALFEHIDTAVRPLLPDAKSEQFRPHLTLGRIKPNARKSAPRLGALLKAEQLDALTAGCEWQVNCVTLYKSVLTPKAPVHTPLERVDLNTSSPHA